MVPDPMISTPFSAWILRIENIRSCLRIVDAPSTPMSSDMATNSAGVFFFSSFKCIKCSFLGKFRSSQLRKTTKLEGGRTPLRGRNSDRQFRKTCRAAGDSRYVCEVPLSIGRVPTERRNDQNG